eukprot:TRINITY_DN19892_c0_g1_i2.p1 TRINITY_DN19892_c0_g1~~TRINITY_DN19892_c0_g1_i2.p1  ORF type:complete len:469 (-),score=93.67 TRINITY_DN19892_c0_g1_i2:113-1519(-)
MEHDAVTKSLQREIFDRVDGRVAFEASKRRRVGPGLEELVGIARSVDRWLDSVIDNRLQTLFLTGLRTQLLRVADHGKAPTVTPDEFWSSLVSVPDGLCFKQNDGLMGEFQRAADWTLADPSPHKYFRAVCLAVGFLRRLCWDLAVDPIDREIEALGRWAEANQEAVSASVLREIRRIVPVYLNHATLTKPVGPLVRLVDDLLARLLRKRCPGALHEDLLLHTGCSEGIGDIAVQWKLRDTHAWMLAHQPALEVPRPMVSFDSKCIVKEIDASDRTVPEWFRQFLDVSERFTVPVVIRGGLHTLASHTELKQRLHEKCAALESRVDPIPYAGTFLGTKSAQRMSWQQYHELEDPDKLYFFNHLDPYQDYAEFQLLDRLLQRIDGIVFRVDSGQIGGGGRGTGAPVHFHRPAFNFLVEGEKEWILFPLDHSMWSNNQIDTFLQSEFQQHQAHCAPVSYTHLTLPTKRIV